jgi:hypothetical protein
VRAAFYALRRPFHLCRDEIDGYTGFDHRFKTFIVFRRPCLTLEAGAGFHDFVLRFIDKPSLFAFLRIAAGGRLSSSAMASKVFVFANSRSDFIALHHSRIDGWIGMLGPCLRLQPDLDQAADGFGTIQFHALTCDPFID